jgi:hypothetical protein
VRSQVTGLGSIAILSDTQWNPVPCPMGIRPAPAWVSAEFS